MDIKPLVKIIKTLQALENFNNHKKDFENNLFDEFFDNIVELINDDEVAEIIAFNIGCCWQAYCSDYCDEIAIVKKVKGRGFPNWDKVFAEVAKKNNIPEKAINRNSCIDHFWDNVSLRDDELRKEFDDFVHIGRSGGYMGLKYSVDMIEIDSNKLRSFIHKCFENTNKIEKLIDKDGWELDDDKISGILYNYIWHDCELKRNINDYIILSKVAEKRFDDLDKKIEEGIECFETTEKWVEEISSNQYWDLDIV